jgi:hypothetical protein
MAKKRKRSLSNRIAEAVINETMMAGMALFLIVMGINYFNMKWSWTQILTKAGAASGFTASAAGTEVSKMLSALADTFPFEYLFVQTDFYTTVIIAVALTVIGFVLKAFTSTSKGKIIMDIGNNIWLPAVVGFAVIMFLQLWTAFNVDAYLATHQIMRPDFGPGYFIWQTYGQLFLLGGALLVIGAVVKLIGEQNHSHKGVLVGDTMFNGAIILLAYYFIIRIMSLDVIMQSEAGRILKLLIISNQYSNFTIVVCMFLFAFGRALKRYGIETHKHEVRMKELDKLKGKYKFMQREYGAKKAEHPPHPKKLHVSEKHHIRKPEHKHPAYSRPDHPVHRYVEPKGRYKKGHK